MITKTYIIETALQVKRVQARSKSEAIGKSGIKEQFVRKCVEA